MAQRAQRTQRRPKARTKSADPSLTFSYKDVKGLERYISEQGYIHGRDRSGLAQKQQRRLAQAIKRARHLAMLPFTQTV